MSFRLSLPLVLPLLLAACTDRQQEALPSVPVAPPVADRTLQLQESSARYDVGTYFPGPSKDSLLADMITFIYRKPPQATNTTRTAPAFRNYYVDQLPLFEQVYHYMDGDSVHWYYLIRPARSVDGTRRGVGGRFTLGADGGFAEFEEVFNTTVLPEVALRDKGLVLFEEMVATGNVDAFLNDPGLIEWPDDRLKYDKVMREWRYVD